MKKYVSFAWTIDENGWHIYDTIEEAKERWCFGMMVFEVNAEDLDRIWEYGREVQSNRLVIEKIKEKYPIIYQEGKPCSYMVAQ